MKIFSWNVNGLRAVMRKGALGEFISGFRPDILLLQETKIGEEQVKEVGVMEEFREYRQVYDFARRPGYSGTAVWCRGVGGEQVRVEDFMDEGRMCVVDVGEFYVVSVYVPNAKEDLSRLKLRVDEWGPWLLNEVESLQRKKPVVVGGDFNVAHEAIDLARPKQNVGKHGFTDEERADFGKLLAGAGLVDSFRELHPQEVEYSWWSHWGKARENNVGWRIDYVLVSGGVMGRVRGAGSWGGVMGSDHCPVWVEIK
jgi:exodeoxyribonuclease-3